MRGCWISSPLLSGAGSCLCPKVAWFHACKRHPIIICGSHSSEPLFQTLPLTPQCSSHAHPPLCLVLKRRSHGGLPQFPVSLCSSVTQHPPFLCRLLQAKVDLSTCSLDPFPSSIPTSDQPSSSLSVDSLSSRDYCCCPVAQSSLTLCDPISWSMTSFPVLHHLPELAKTCVH